MGMKVCSAAIATIAAIAAIGAGSGQAHCWVRTPPTDQPAGCLRPAGP
jgi:hypothetical protein